MRWRTWTTILVIVMAGTLVAGTVPLFTADVASAQVSPASDFVTGGGWIRPDGNAKANFGVAGGCKKGAFWGHLEYVDHGSANATGLPTPFRVHWESIIAYSPAGADGVDSKGQPTGTRDISGTATINDNANSTVSFFVTVSDNGEGKSNTVGDMFSIVVTDFATIFYEASGTLEGGNIQLHNGTPCGFTE
jgi:hypothetical protein